MTNEKWFPVYVLAPVQKILFNEEGIYINYNFKGSQKMIRPDNTLQDLYRYIDCELVDVVTVNIEGTDIDLWVDDEGLYDQSKGFSLKIGEPENPDFKLLAGPVVFTSCNSEGETTGLTTEEINKVKRFIQKNLLPLELQYLLRKRMG